MNTEIENESLDDLQNLSREELILLVKKLRKNNSGKSTPSEKNSKTSFNFNKYKKRHIALKFLYLGWDYSGFAAQVTTDKTIEHHLFQALMKTKLIEAREVSNYHRCGRTDKGVSAFSQVISLDVRSNLKDGKGVITPENFMESEAKFSEKEIDYPTILNRVLPPEIRIIGWAPVDPLFSSRFDCTSRIYKYWFPLANLNIEEMKKAGLKLVGEHDFRNICKMDVGNGVVNYKRRIFSVDIEKISSGNFESYSILELTVVGQAFLWHQIRCIMSLLFLVGQGKEDCSVIEKLLDVDNFPRKPQYDMASELPLVLYDCSYDDVNWNYDQTCLFNLIKHLQSLWTHQVIKTTIIKRMLQDLESISENNTIIHQLDCLLPGVKPRVYKRLMDRQCCDSLEERLNHQRKKQKKLST
ncbi:tRNA pseudouridine(38/39) synthase isoform X1 [Parasteatoda tepidariorum]|uniref:tRNA pseudouridine(38/39) synthase isoform X1 n=1 Tax=Parasteatoda tepidariorum TaxID=114398 RepID=UPI00077F91C7|nr:tRNA pseudouridine(38/39) synthase isoform X2 [Parasteatoda tepidariorum]